MFCNSARLRQFTEEGKSNDQEYLIAFVNRVRYDTQLYSLTLSYKTQHIMTLYSRLVKQTITHNHNLCKLYDTLYCKF